VVVVGADVVGAVVVGAAVVAVGVSGAGVVVVEVGRGAVGVVVTPLLSILKSARRLEVAPFDHLSTTLMLGDPSASFVVSYA
jgi:hypothetical protein